MRQALTPLLNVVLIVSVFCPAALGAAPRPGVPKKPASRPPDAAILYNRSLKADDLYSYRGRQITTYWRTGRAVAVIVSHRAPSLRRIDYLAPDSRRGSSVVTDSTQEWLYDARSKQLRHRRLAPDAEAVADAADRYDLLRANYILQVLPQARTWADRKVFLLTITRRTNRTPARKLWVDAATGVVLKRESYREDGKLALTVAFSDVNSHAPLPRSLFNLSALAARPGVKTMEEKPSGESSVTLANVAHQLGGAARSPSHLAGYRLVSAALTPDGKTLHLRYSDGLNLVSLFEQRRTQLRRPTRVPPTMHPTRIGQRAGYISHRASLTTLNWDTGALNFTLMGEIAESSLQDLAAQADH
ncbi:MAG: hypothetical protein M3Y28_09720 [Armatimonadota bacterium]|nr:hypothetical protein [Armatimonadota bacterium]